MRFKGLILDFDGVLLDSEFEGNRHLAELLTALGHQTGVGEAIRKFSGLSGESFIAAIEQHIGERLPAEFHALRHAEDERVLRDGIAEVAGAIAFVRSLPPQLPKAIASSSTSDWIETHLDHLGIRDSFGTMIFSGREHVARGKPAPDIYLYAARALGLAIEECAIVEDSEVGAQGALASGATVIGLVVGSHCPRDHAERLRALGVCHIARSFADVTEMIA